MNRNTRYGVYWLNFWIAFNVLISKIIKEEAVYSQLLLAKNKRENGYLCFKSYLQSTGISHDNALKWLYRVSCKY